MLKIVLLVILMFNSNFIFASEEISASQLDLQTISAPELVTGNKSPTINGMGYIFLTISPIGEIFLKEEAQASKNLLEIGAGYNNIPIEALKRGVLQYTANDISKEHLNILAYRVKEQLGNAALKNLILIEGKAPTDLPIKKNEYDAILADKVIHFMKPEEIIRFIEWSKSALKKNGKIYITTASPYSKTYHKILPNYLEKLEQNIDFPGHFTNIMQSVDKSVMQNYPKYLVPNEMVLFSRNDLVKLFEKNGMKVIKSYSFKIPTETEHEYQIVSDTESNLVGIIATLN
ncbi:MAG: class I SAM-dependent methyltransferase [Alphaproteobacteria bacterium]